MTKWLSLYWGRYRKKMGLPGGTSGKEPTCQCRRHKRRRFNPRIGRIPWRRAWQPTLVLLPGKSPRTEEPGRLQSIESRRVGHDWGDLAQIEYCVYVCVRERKDRGRRRKGELAMCTANKWTAETNYLFPSTVCFLLRLTIHSLLQTSFWCCQLYAKHCTECYD